MINDDITIAGSKEIYFIRTPIDDILFQESLIFRSERLAVANYWIGLGAPL
jgi:hypothetical protein